MVKEGYVLLITIAVMLRKYAVTPIFRCETQCSTNKLIYATLMVLGRTCIQSKEISASSIILSKGKCPLSDSLPYLHRGFSDELFHGNEFSYYYYSSSICVYLYLCMYIHTEILREDIRYPLLSFSASETDSSTLNLKLIFFFYFAKISGQEASVILLCPHP